MKPNTFIKSEESIVSGSAPPAVSSSLNQYPTVTEMVQIQPLITTLLEMEFPLFEEATQTASRFLNMPICFVGLAAQSTLVLKAAVGLSQLGLMNPLARTRRLPLEDSLVNTVLQQQRSIVLSSIPEQGTHAQSCLVQEYGIQAYIGVPLLTSEGQCLGLIAAMDTNPHGLPAEAIAFIELVARWSTSEYERLQLTKVLATSKSALPSDHAKTNGNSLLDAVRLTLMSQLTQDMRNPLTTIKGMANMLSREIYGPLTPKQREYADIVCSSSQCLLEIANEVLELSSLNAQINSLKPTSVDIDMIGQHVRQMLAPLAQQNGQDIRFTVEPSSRLWTLDKDLVRQLLYHLVFGIIHLSGEGGTIRVHGSERDNTLTLNVWMTHPWLGEGLPSTVAEFYQNLSNAEQEAELLAMLLAKATDEADAQSLSSSLNPTSVESSSKSSADVLRARETLSLLLSRHLTERHGGSLALQGSIESGYRFLIVLPFLKSA